MTQTRIIYVPGKNPKPRPTEHREQLWRCLTHGVSIVDAEAGRAVASDPSIFVLAAWNHEYYGKYSDLDKDLRWIDILLQQDRPSERDRSEARTWSRWMVRLMYALGDRFHALIPLIPDRRIKATIADTNPYFDNRDGVASRIREIVKQPLRAALLNNERILLIGHSMGSVIAYDALWELSHIEKLQQKIELFLTLGSPLGMHYVQNHLLGFKGKNKRYPLTVKKWKNVASVGDLVSVDSTISDDFSPMIKEGVIEQTEDYCRNVFNWFRNELGLNVHKSYGYLVNPLVSRIIADWWRQRESASISQYNCSDKNTVPELVAHRGFPQRYPENTLIGYKNAVAAGACYLECDIQLTADHVPVLYHDKGLTRVSGVGGLITDLTFAELAQHDARYAKKFGDRYAGTPIATLEQFADFLLLHKRANAFIELKRQSISRFGVAAVVDRVMQDLEPVRDQSVLLSFDADCLAYARKHYAIRVGWVLPAWTERNEIRARALLPEFLFCNTRIIPKNRKTLWQGSWRWAVYVVNEPATAFEYARVFGIDLIETDAIGEMLADPGLSQRGCH